MTDSTSATSRDSMFLEIGSLSKNLYALCKKLDGVARRIATTVAKHVFALWSLTSFPGVPPIPPFRFP